MPSLGEPPKDLATNKLWRAWLLDLSFKRKRVREYLADRCAHDIKFWIDSFVYQYNPNFVAGGAWEELGPFILAEFQEHALDVIDECIRNKKDLVIDKSREMGASWKCLLKMGHSTLFDRWRKYLCISRNKEAVDDPGDPDSLFWKLDFVYEHLPKWMTEKSFDFNTDGKIKRKSMLILNHLTKSRITGQATSGAAGVGGRAHAMFIDEFSLIREDYEVLAHTANTTSCRIFNGTQRGTDKAFHELTEMGRRGLIRKLDLHWTLHPDKWRGAYRFDDKQNKIVVLDTKYRYPEDFRFVYSVMPAGGPHPGVRSPYYDEQCTKQVSNRAIAQNLDMDAVGAVGPVFNPVTIQSLIATYAKPPKWEGELQFDMDTGKPIALVPVPGGPLRLWITPPADMDFPPDWVGIGNDLSNGVGASPSVLAGASKRSGEKIVEYCTRNLPPERFAEVACAIGWLFKNEYGTPALVAWEANGPGENFGKRFAQLGYPNPWHSEKKLSIGRPARSANPGWRSNPEAKNLLITSYMFAISTRQFLERCEETLKECMSYRYENGNVIHPEQKAKASRDSRDQSALGVNHGDRVIATALAWKMIKDELGYTTNVKEKERRETAPINSIAGRIKLRANQETSSWADAATNTW